MTDREVLNTISMQLGEVKGHVQGIRGEVKGVRKDVSSINKKLGEMPDEWRKDAEGIVESKLKQRDDVSEAVDLAEERARAKYGKNYSTPPGAKRDSGWKVFWQGATKPLVGLGLAIGFAIGCGAVYANCVGIDKIDLKALEDSVVERVRANGGTAPVP